MDLPFGISSVNLCYRSLTPIANQLLSFQQANRLQRPCQYLNFLWWVFQILEAHHRQRVNPYRRKFLNGLVCLMRQVFCCDKFFGVCRVFVWHLLLRISIRCKITNCDAFFRPALPETGAHPSSNILATGASILLSGLALLGIRKKMANKTLKDRNELVFLLI